MKQKQKQKQTGVSVRNGIMHIVVFVPTDNPDALQRLFIPNLSG